MTKTLTLFLPIIMWTCVAYGFTPVIENPYYSIYHDTDNLEILTLYSRINDLEQRYNAALAREQSLGNRILSGVAIGAGGIGGMMLASGIAEQRADENAERDMAAYLATFRCDYGAGMNVLGGETNIQLPGGNILLPLYNEYIALAMDLKARKEILDIAPGIESEIISDAAQAGLYDNVSVGITDGTYTSISRALTNPTGDDANEWANQKSATSQKIETGGIVGGIGVIGGAVGNVVENVIYNKKSDKNVNITQK